MLEKDFAHQSVNVLHTRTRTRFKLALANPKQELDRSKILFGNILLTFAEFVPDDAFEVWARGGWFCACCAETAAVEV